MLQKNSCHLIAVELSTVDFLANPGSHQHLQPELSAATFFTD